jgi:hypothetical protein
MSIMSDTPEMRSAAYKEAIQRKNQIVMHGITADMTQEQLDAKVIDLAEAKSVLTGKPVSTLAAGQEWYVNDMHAFAQMNAQERYDWGRSQSFADTASNNELLDSLAD